MDGPVNQLSDLESCLRKEMKLVRLKLVSVLDWLQVDVIVWADLFDLLIEGLDHAHIDLSKAALLIIDR